NQLGLLLKYKNSPYKKRSELFMRDVYKAINFTTYINEVLLKKLNPIANTKAKKIKNNTFLIIQDDCLEISPNFKETSITPYIFDVFITFQKHTLLKSLGPKLMMMLQNSSKEINDTFRKNKNQQQKFLSILKSDDKVNRSLRIMNKCNLIGAFIPAFGKIVSQMQHDLFHIYTVDEHILNVVRNLRRFAKDELKHEFPDCYDLFKNYKNKYILYLAALFHDIAKGRGGDHSELGAKDADQFSSMILQKVEVVIILNWELKMQINSQDSIICRLKIKNLSNGWFNHTLSCLIQHKN
ncbi:MAG: HD domain-containing protein, partial [Alphaproteobacteria bacterium]|nr:HD domain-containing protein [Candidatus Fonsibacter sp. PEL55]